MRFGPPSAASGSQCPGTGGSQSPAASGSQSSAAGGFQSSAAGGSRSPLCFGRSRRAATSPALGILCALALAISLLPPGHALHAQDGGAPASASGTFAFTGVDVLPMDGAPDARDSTDGTPDGAAADGTPDGTPADAGRANGAPANRAPTDDGFADGAIVLRNRTVVVVDGTIVEVGPAGEVDVPEGATVVDGSGRYLMPGLAEMHAHVPPGDDPPREAVEEMLFLYLANGITTIRGMLGSPYQIPLAREIERGEVLGPNFYVGAPSINGGSAPTPDDAERLVRRHVEAGYDFQKVHPGVSLETWDRMVEVARSLDFTWAGHVPADVGLVHAIETGISTVDHLDGYVQAVAPEGTVAQVGGGEMNLAPLADGDGVDEAHIDEIVRLTVEHDVYVVPTMYLWENLYRDVDPDDFLALPEMRYVSPEQRAAWREQAAGGPRGSPEAVETFVDLRMRILRALSDAGAGILMGTDSPQLFNVPGFSLHRELELMAEAGMSNAEILRSGTTAPERYVRQHLGIDHTFGSVAAGHRADLLLLEANPLADLEHLTETVGVMVRGRWLPREEIDRRLEEIAAKYAGSSP